MRGQVFTAGAVPQVIAYAAVAIGMFWFTPQSALAVQCDVAHHGPTTEADRALISADYAKAASLYRADLPKRPDAAESMTGLVHALLRQDKVQEASGAVNSALTTAPNSAVLLTLRGEVEYRQGLPWAAAASANQSTHLDPCNARNMLLVAKIARLNSLYATARAMVTTAHKLDPQDPEISEKWTEAPAEQGKICHLASLPTAIEVPFINLMSDGNTLRAYGLNVKVNNRNAQLVIDTGASGLLISRSVA
jgi:cytochrome c-type biogenesis protein CcmH/NrfG